MADETPSARMPANGDAAAATSARGELEKLVTQAEHAANPLGLWLAPLAAPPVLGLVLIILVAFGAGSSILTDSAGTASTALWVGAVLILGSAALYVLSPTRSEQFFVELRKHVERFASTPSSAGTTGEPDTD